ncbi:hypothetical protein [Acetivibrio straminisolvens]|uniref:Uncharacterized protein n=1 Tax=Acetivibrio straminisolvens JCM 21531 TaxID=1294263 RepID=W4V463_9FIRM|nr:hypothetical protein [Acetivibrio straminisolvens]GAE87623.1 hypothetical protein JCM21531_1009 [Acetivibrio straminisolvens JCM 21531]
MQVKHIENYSTLRWNRKTPALIEKQIVSILDHINNLIEQKYDPKVLLEIEKHLSTAHDLYHSSFLPKQSRNTASHKH